MLHGPEVNSAWTACLIIRSVLTKRKFYTLSDTLARSSGELWFNSSHIFKCCGNLRVTGLWCGNGDHVGKMAGRGAQHPTPPACGPLMPRKHWSCALSQTPGRSEPGRQIGQSLFFLSRRLTTTLRDSDVHEQPTAECGSCPPSSVRTLHD